jgi:hypothetical protein
MTDIQVIGLTINYHTKPTPRGHCILAYFDAKVGPFIIKGCALVRTVKQGLATWMPRLDDTRQHHQRALVLVDEPTRHQLLIAAREMYVRMGATGAEWRSRDDFDAEGNPLHPHRGCDEQGYPTHPSHPNYERQADDPEHDQRQFLSALNAELADDRPDHLASRPPAIPMPAELPRAITSMMDKRIQH